MQGPRSGHLIICNIVLQEIEREDQAWEQSRKSKPKHGRNLAEEEAECPFRVLLKIPAIQFFQPMYDIQHYSTRACP
jgi:hypothetical protein